jgi:hypothetical protein
MHPDKRVADLLVACPSLTSKLHLSQGPNYIMGQVGLMLRDGSLDKNDERCVYDYLNKLAHTDLDSQNLLVVNVLEILTDTPEAIARARSNLSGHASFLFEKVVRGWNCAKR